MIVYNEKNLFPIRKNGIFIYPDPREWVKLLELNGQLLYVNYNNVHYTNVESVETSLFTVEINNNRGIVVEYGTTYEAHARAKHILAGNIIRVARNRQTLIPSDITDIESIASTRTNFYDTVFCTSKNHDSIVIAHSPITPNIDLGQICEPNLTPIIYIGTTTHDKYVLERILTTIREIDRKIRAHVLPSGNTCAQIWQYVIAITNWDYQNNSIDHNVYRRLDICNKIQTMSDEQIWNKLNTYLEDNFPEKAPAYRQEIIDILTGHSKQ